MTRQLVAQCFFEMMLCGKASKIEDRFYAILPQSKYKDKINQVAHWKLNNMVSVKLKLFEIMDTKDKLTLLFLAGCNVVSSFTDQYPLNFDLGNKSTITLHHHARDLHLYYFLQLTAKKYCVIDLPSESDCNDDSFILMKPMMTKACDDLQLNLASSEIKIVCLTYFDESTLNSDAERDASNNCKLYLFGCFEKNKWMLITLKYFNEWSHHYVNNNGTVFNIY
ncbi:hypothetical protein BCR42DRAFT_430467 [Absidia repens]|uniref:Uncharacterized protein n=1 Tax=Absidia repens TaxID=90262 RepID=A0A1X2HE06_9FUNG|nr:hypothetical protein BCR42DRAFT_430467 [Absidia repens]